MLIARGYDVALYVDGELIRCSRGSEILHDESGKDWPKSEVLILPFEKTGKRLERVPHAVRQHFGAEYAPMRGTVKLPPKTGWREVGVVERIEYARRGHLADEYEHTFGERSMFSFGGRRKPTLHRRGEALRIVGVTWDWTGAVG